MPELDGLQFITSVDTQGSESKLDALARALKKISQITGLAQVGKDVKNFANNVTSIDQDKIDRLGEALKKIRISKTVGDNTRNFTDAANGLSEDTVARWERMAQVFQSDGFSNLSSALAGFQGIQMSEDTATNIQDVVTALQSLDATTIQNWAQMAAILQSIPQVNIPNLNNASSGGSAPNTSTALVPYNAAMAQAGAAAQTFAAQTVGATTGARALSLQLGQLVPVAKAFGKQLLDVGKASLMATTALPRMLGERFFTQVKKATAGMGQFLGSLKRVAMYRLIRSAIAALTQGFQEGIKNLYAYSNAMGTVFANSMDRLSSASLYLKNSLAAMAAPIINAIVPAIEVAIDAIVRLINWINMLISAVSGKSITTVAKKVGTSFDGAASSAGGAAKAAKELKKTILSFDELNVLNDQNTGSGGGGGGGGAGGAYSDMFEEVQVPTEISDFASRLREAFEAQDWMSLGKILGEKFNEIVDTIKWADLGDKVGGGLRMVIDTSLSFLRTADFQAVGRGLADFFNHGIAAVDWGNLGGLLVRKVTSIIDIVIGFLNNLDFGQVTAAISDFIRGFWDEISMWLDSVNWRELGDNIGRGLVEAVKNIKMADILGAFGRFLESLFGAVGNLAWGIVKGVWDEIFGKLNSKIKKEKPEPIKLSIFNNAKELWKKINGWLASAMVGSPFLVKSKIFNNASDIWQGFLVLLKAAMAGSPLLIIAKIFNNASSIWQGFLNLLKLAMAGSPLQIIPQIINNASDLWNKVKGWFNGKSSEGLSTKVNVTSNVDSVVKTIKSSISGIAKTALTATVTMKVPKLKVEWATSSYNGNSVQYPKITPQYAAKGAILDAATLFGSASNPLIAGEAGKEAILPLERNTGWMDNIADRLADRVKGDQDNYTSTYMALVDFYQAYMRDDMSSIRNDARRQADKDETISVSSEAVTASLARKNLRDGRTTVPVG